MDLKSAENTTLAKYQDLIALLSLIGAVIFFVWKAPYGFGFADESWYLTLAHRLTKGDSLFVDEWHVGQLTGFLLYLPTKIYLALSGTTEGIILFFRYLFIVLQGSVATLIYVKLRNYGFVSIFAALIFFLHIPFTIMALGYYSMGIAFVVATGVLLATAKTTGKAVFIFTGVLFACAVLCNPVLIIVYFVYFASMILFETGKKRNHRFFKFTKNSFSFKTWFLVSIGAFSIFVLFVIFLFSGTGLTELTENFPLLLTDPEYRMSNADSAMRTLFKFKETLLEIISINPYLVAAFTLLTAVIFFDKKRTVHRLFYLPISAVVTGVFIFYLIVTADFPYFGYWMFPLAWLGLICYLLSEDKNQTHFVFLWLFGLIYAVCLNISSFMRFIVSSQALTLSCIASVLFINNVIKELQKQEICNTGKRGKHQKTKNLSDTTLVLVATMLLATMPLQIVLEMYIVADLKLSPEYIVYDEAKDYSFARASIDKASKEQLNTRLSYGPEKSIKTTVTRANIYEGIINDLSKIKEKDIKPVLIASNMPWCYLYLDMPYATHSAWFLDYVFDEQKNRLLDYYELHPEKSPGYIYIPKYIDLLYIYYPERADEMLTGFGEVFDFTVTESGYGFTLEIIGS